MQSLLKDAQEYLQILHNCRTQQVVYWKGNDLKRAVDWALHFQKVYMYIYLYVHMYAHTQMYDAYLHTCN